MNNQKPIPQALTDSSNLIVNEIFYTLQGEGPFSGEPAVFVRMGGCNLACTWCDTEYTVGNKSMSIADILATVIDVALIPGCLVVITGGEPFRQDISRLCSCLVLAGHKVQIETNGTLAIPNFNYKHIHLVVSPKTKYLHPAIENNLQCLKYVVSSDDAMSDTGTPVYSTQEKGGGTPKYFFKQGCKVYLSPLDSKSEEQNHENMQTATDLCLKFGHTLSLQTHKIVGLQ